jgi:hypothetical protein
MAVNFKWDNEEKTVVRYVAEGDWNWKDYHHAVRVASFAMHRIEHDVDVILDLTRTDKTPSGAVAHLRSVGKPQSPCMTGRAVVIGLDPATETKILAGRDERVLPLPTQTLYFVDTEAEAQTLLQRWQD